MALPRVDKAREGWYLILFSGSCAVWLTALTWHELRNNVADGPLETALAIGRGMESAVVVMAASTITLVEGYAMLAERYLRRRYREGRQEGRREGRQEGRREGRQEGRQETLDRLREVAAARRIDDAAIDRLIEEFVRNQED